MRAIFLLMVFAGALLVFPGKVQAVFDLSVTQIDGGFDLRFGRVEPSDFKLVKQLTLRVNSDTGKAYRVFQQLLQPLATPQGEPLDPEQFKMYALQGSNSRGTLIYRQEEPVVQAQTLVYTSNTTGENDSFQLVYTITPKENQAPGSYYGRMAFILIPVDAAMSQVVVNVQISVELTTGSATVADIVTNTGSDRIVIDTEDMHVTREGVEGSWPQVNIKVAGPLGAPYRVYQSLEGGDVTTSDGYNFDLDKVAVLYEGGRQGMISAASTLKGARQRQLIYASDPRGSSDEITITYKPTQDFRLAKDGLYRGRLVLYIDVDQMTGPAQPKLKTLDVEFHVSPVFDIRVYSQDQEGVALEFGNISYKSGPKSSENEIFVESNLGKPYTIVQMVSSPMVSESGEKVSGDSFVMKVKDVVSDETPKAYVQEFVPVREGENKIFSSGPAGASARLKVEYRLTMGAESKAGNYKTRIGYSLVLD
ncbi:MAG: hypothetical protein PHH75_02015 [Candidatus Omnitrophica bacterium]|nr:hypothetical protein [Candidatus Omnitrophota bacterium]MDD5573936.1 hypothetical protein [Candidatus Omnitrophota bacterium]